MADDLRAIERDSLASDERQFHAQGFGWPFGAWLAPAARALARRLPTIDLAAGHGHAEQILVDRVGFLLCAHTEAAFFEIFLLVGARLRVFLLDFADRRDDGVVALRLHREVEADLIIAHAGAAVRDRARA